MDLQGILRRNCEAHCSITARSGTSRVQGSFGSFTSAQCVSALRQLAAFAFLLLFLVAFGSSCSGGSSSTPAPTPTVPAAPTGLTAAAGNAQVSLSWSGSSGATSYNVYRSTTSGGEGSTTYQTGIATASFTDRGVTNGRAYFYTVAARNGSGTSPQSSEATATPSAGFISSVSTDAARYAPGSTATIYVSLTNTTGVSASGDVGINLTQLGSLQASLPAQAFSLANGGTDTLTSLWCNWPFPNLVCTKL